MGYGWVVKPNGTVSFLFTIFYFPNSSFLVFRISYFNQIENQNSNYIQTKFKLQANLTAQTRIHVCNIYCYIYVFHR
jgi:hypothetical protein